MGRAPAHGGRPRAAATGPAGDQDARSGRRANAGTERCPITMRSISDRGGAAVDRERGAVDV
ncbi:MAG: hypothetical protein ACREQ5_16745, partial [Candidatus Dormibacteria bacterium]